MTTWSLPDDVERALWSAASARLPEHVLSSRTLVPAIVARSRRYTSERDQPAPAAPPSEPLRGRPGTAARAAARGRSAASGRADEQADLAARALFFTVADAAKIMIPLAELAGRGALPASDLRVLDVGAGAGAMTLGALAFLHESAGLAGRDIAVTAVDRDGDALAICERAVAALARDWRGSIRLSTFQIDVTRSELMLPRADDAGAGHDLVLAGSVLNELAEPARYALVRRLVSALAPGGALVLIEPALRDLARDLHRLRDWVIRENLAHVFAPCTRATAPCPMLTDDRDWCHEDRATRLPERAAQLARATGLRRYGLKFAYLVLRTEPLPLIPPEHVATLSPSTHDALALRVVSRLDVQKGKRTLHACGDCGRVTLRLLHRNRSPANRPLERAGRGDVVVGPFSQLNGDRVEVEPHHAIVLVHPSRRPPP